MMKTVGNNQYSFTFVNTEVTIDNEEEYRNLANDPIDTSDNIQIKSEIDLQWEESIDEDQIHSSDNVEHSIYHVTPDDVPCDTTDPLAENNDPLASSSQAAIITDPLALRPQGLSTCSTKRCSKVVIHPVWIEHCYYRIMNNSKCEDCPKSAVKINEISLECMNCSKKFNSQHGLYMHSLYCSEYKCKHCLLKFSKRTKFKRHMRVKHQQSILGCKNCHKIFENNLALHLHLFKCFLLKCDTCYYQTHQKQNMIRHIFKLHMTENGQTMPFNPIHHDPKACPRCGKTYKNRNVIKSHLSYCQKKTQQCFYCAYKTQRLALLTMHVKSSHVKNESSKICTKCGRILESESSTEKHYFFCPLKVLSCNYCVFKTKYGLCLKLHLLKQHCTPKQAKFECPKCLKVLRNHTSFQSHLRSCFGNPEMLCDFCDYKTNKPSSLSDHVLIEHCQRKKNCRIPCSNCGQKFMSMSKWKTHKSSCEKSRKKRKYGTLKK